MMMHSRMVIALAVVLLCCASAGSADDCAPGEMSVTYFDGTQLSGATQETTCRRWQGPDFQVDVNWGQGGPLVCIRNCPGKDDGLIPPTYKPFNDSFSARFQGRVFFEAGTYEFRAMADDGLRVRLDSELLVDAWALHSARTYTVSRAVSAGWHEVTVEYFEAAGLALIRVGWRRVGP
jgi:hypothetical protein